MKDCRCIIAALALGAVCVMSALAAASPAVAADEEPGIYYARHATLWYYTAADFKKFESLLREGPAARLSGYGPKDDFLRKRLDALYSLAACRLGVPSGNGRLLVVIRDRRAGNRDIFNLRGMRYASGGAWYDPETRAVYVDPDEATLCDVARGMVGAIMHDSMPALYLGRSGALVLAPAADGVCSQLSGGWPYPGRILY